MVPYVRKSFYKHYRDGLIYIKKMKENDISTFVKFLNEKTPSINDEHFNDDDC